MTAKQAAKILALPRPVKTDILAHRGLNHKMGTADWRWDRNKRKAARKVLRGAS